MNDESKVYGALAYFLGLISGLVLLFVKPEDEFVKFHSLQSILLSIVLMIIGIIVGFIMRILWFIPIIGWIMNFFIYFGFGLIIIIIWVLLMWKAYQGKKCKFPLVGNQAEKMVETVNVTGNSTTKKEIKTSKKN